MTTTLLKLSKKQLHLMYIDKMKPDDDLVAKTEKFVHHAETSRPKDHVLGKRPVEENPLSKNFYRPIFTQISDQAYYPAQSSIGFASSLMNSMYSIDFGNYDYGLHFEDGTIIQDESLTDVLDEVFHNPKHNNNQSSSEGKDSALPNMMHWSAEYPFPKQRHCCHRRQSSFEKSHVEPDISPSDIHGFKASPMENQKELDSVVSQGTAPRRIWPQINNEK
ncbi:unnamed protein product [Brassica oleracea]|uniref:NAC domain-containing protein n=1 Tax=Brassica oleracea var. oleracea TaxID=109376 RepID=A0A0D2ZQU9_BRAOL